MKPGKELFGHTPTEKHLNSIQMAATANQLMKAQELAISRSILAQCM